MTHINDTRNRKVIHTPPPPPMISKAVSTQKKRPSIYSGDFLHCIIIKSLLYFGIAFQISCTSRKCIYKKFCQQMQQSSDIFFIIIFKYSSHLLLHQRKLTRYRLTPILNFFLKNENITAKLIMFFSQTQDKLFKKSHSWMNV